MKHTKGPWTLTMYRNQALEIRGKDTRLVHKIELPDEEDGKNAYLIAAAPELLEALEDCLNHFNYAEERESREYAEEVKALIKKARGEK